MTTPSDRSGFSGRKDWPLHAFNLCTQSNRLWASGSVSVTVDVNDFFLEIHIFFNSISLLNTSLPGSKAIDIARAFPIKLTRHFDVIDTVFKIFSKYL
ncbi:hypothetical protein AYI70_g4331 [Smittium culicis]|uniref:Uncharacterized protein n=1 Tax=Smittium culicis TaxID=133412 RepID=A0A1R1XPI6_9FUNG|nr:hypothetical protein AYI70_g6528 [Smittium culicis]OMJ20099.1 hypothetical protein AYI70_g4331 [Smittium culicis]